MATLNLAGLARAHVREQSAPQTHQRDPEPKRA